jgi:tRNA threonylcarbamoyladenosine biosynthesis protein TsaB
MAYSLGLPMVEVPTLYALAYQARTSWPDAAYYLPLIDARRTEVYAVLYDHALAPIGPVMSVCLDDPAFAGMLPPSGDVIICGDGGLKIPGDLLARTGLRIDRTLIQDATLLPGPAAERLAAGRTADSIRFVPDYLKPPNITTPKNR